MGSEMCIRDRCGPGGRGRKGCQSLLAHDHLQAAGGGTLRLPPRRPAAVAQPSQQGHLVADAQRVEGNLRSQKPAAQSQRLNPSNSQLRCRPVRSPRTTSRRAVRPAQLADAPCAPHGFAGRLPFSCRIPEFLLEAPRIRQLGSNFRAGLQRVLCRKAGA